MTLSELIELLTHFQTKYGDLPVYHLNRDKLRTVLPSHSQDDYRCCFWTGETWDDMGLKPCIILDSDPHSEDPLELKDDEYPYFRETR